MANRPDLLEIQNRQRQMIQQALVDARDVGLVAGNLVTVQASALNVVKKIKEARDALAHVQKLCVCERFKTKGFDYREVHPNLGKADSGSRWTEPREFIAGALKDLG